MSPSDSAPVLQLEDLHVRFAVPHGEVHAVRGLNLQVGRGEVAAVVGESGSGKSAAMLAVLGLLAPNATVTGSALVDGEQVLGGSGAVLRRLRGGRIGMIFQDPMTSLNPVLRIGRQLAEAVIAHQKVSAKQAEAKAVELLELVSIPNAGVRVRSFPHELSGGMRQRVMIAMAMANDPQIIIADEPTTALDVTIQAQILQVLSDLREQRNLSMVLITHDLGVVAGIADSVHVMYAGEAVERGPVVELFHGAQHPYTRGLLDCLPRLDRRAADLVPIGGMPPSLSTEPVGCPFAPRCRHAVEQCRVDAPRLRQLGPVEVACHLAPVTSSTSVTSVAAVAP